MGKEIDPFNPDPAQITLVDIAHALSNTCRWGGHVMRFYSVAEHSIFVQNMVQSREDKIAAMFHDASEAYISDIISPVKHRLEQYAEIENRLMIAIAQKIGFLYPLSDAVKQADEYALRWEYHNIVISHNISPMSPVQAKRAFMDIMDILVKQNWCWACRREVLAHEVTSGGRHDEDKGGCGCYLH